MKENGYDKDDDILLLKHGGNDSSELSDTDMSYDYFEEPIIQSYTQNLIHWLFLKIVLFSFLPIVWR